MQLVPPPSKKDVRNLRGVAAASQEEQLQRRGVVLDTQSCFESNALNLRLDDPHQLMGKAALNSHNTTYTSYTCVEEGAQPNKPGRIQIDIS